MIDDIFAFLASSVLLIMKDSLISFKEFVLIFSPKTCFVLSSYPNRVKIRIEQFRICFNPMNSSQFYCGVKYEEGDGLEGETPCPLPSEKGFYPF